MSSSAIKYSWVIYLSLENGWWLMVEVHASLPQHVLVDLAFLCSGEGALLDDILPSSFFKFISLVWWFVSLYSKDCPTLYIQGSVSIFAAEGKSICLLFWLHINLTLGNLRTQLLGWNVYSFLLVQQLWDWGIEPPITREGARVNYSWAKLALRMKCILWCISICVEAFFIIIFFLGIVHENFLVLFMNISYRSVAVIKSNKDTRYGLDSIVTHDGMKLPCWALPTLSSFKRKFGQGAYDKVS